MTLAAKAATKRILDLTLEIRVTMVVTILQPNRPPRSRVKRLALSNTPRRSSALRCRFELGHARLLLKNG
jgi:hypothetical protein